MNNERRNAIAKISPLMDAINEKIAEAVAILEDVKSDEESMYDEMSEGRQNGDKGEEAQSCINAMSTLIDELQSINITEQLSELAQAVDRDLPEITGRISKVEAQKRRDARLPQWAKDHMRRLVEQAERAEEKLSAKYQAPGKDSRKPVFGGYHSPLAGMEIPTDQVEFPQVGIRLSYDHQLKAVEVYGMNMGSLVVRANSSNVMYIKATRDF